MASAVVANPDRARSRRRPPRYSDRAAQEALGFWREQI